MRVQTQKKQESFNLLLNLNMYTSVTLFQLCHVDMQQVL